VARRASIERFEDVLDELPDGILIVDDGGHIVHANRTFEELSGYRSGDLVGQTVEMLVPEALRPFHSDYRDEYVSSGMPRRPMGTGLDIVMLRKDGSELSVDIALRPLRRARERYAVAAVRDATERKRAERIVMETVQREREHLEAINAVMRAILEGEEDLDALLHLVTQRARALVGASLASIAMPHPEDPSILRIQAADGDRAPDILGQSFPVKGSISGEVMRSRHPLIIPDVSSDPRAVQPVVALGNVGPALFVPLGASGIGTLALGNMPGERTFGVEDLALLEVFAAQTAVAIEYARVQQELKRLAVVEDRERIAKELHDGVIQALFAVGMGLQAAESLGDVDSIRGRVAAAVGDIDRVIRDLRNYIFGLGPELVADRQLGRALTDLAKEFGDAAVAVRVDPDAAADVSGKAADVVQIAREALSNAVRHADAHTVELRLARGGSGVVLSVTDDGKGFDPAEPSAGLGLGNLRERTTRLGGTLAIDSLPGKGTAVSVTIPV
jgi:PAS domain S-box-containing protein